MASSGMATLGRCSALGRNKQKSRLRGRTDGVARRWTRTALVAGGKMRQNDRGTDPVRDSIPSKIWLQVPKLPL
jgi:hypothetical protein